MSQANPNPNARWAAIYEAMTGASAPGHHEAPVGTNPESITSGHEPDRWDAKGIIAVPILVIVVTAVVYGIVTGVFALIQPGKPTVEPTMSPFAVERGEKPLNDRMARISLADPAAPVQQPRLEGLQVMNQTREGRQQPDPPNLRSFSPIAGKENTYYVKPQDLYPDFFIDPLTGRKILAEYDWVSKDKNVARIPVNEAIRILAGKLPARADGKAPDGTSSKPKLSNGGHDEVPAVKK